jgi:starch-binding outer membrane protein, SusD/RagB family
MKKLFYIIPLALIVLSSTQSGCKKSSSFLDKQSTNNLNEQTVFADSAHTMDFLAGVYVGMQTWRSSTPNSAGPEHHLDAVTDEATQRYPSAGMFENQVITGSFGGTWTSYLANSWSVLYTNIRGANVFMSNVQRSPLSSALKARTTAEARFLRAYYYSLLMEGWGGVPIVGDTVYNLEASSTNLRSTYADCVDYVVSELDAVASQLPVEYTGLDYGRITKGACLALKSRVLLFAASPLFNGGSVATDPNVKPLTGYVNADPNRWQKALQAAQDVVNLNTYQLETDNTTKPGYGFYQVFLKRVNDEYILPYMMPPNVFLETYNLPPSRSWWNGYHRTPTQNLVDAFPMANGKSIDDASSGYDAANPYVGRDPRFYYSIIYNGSSYYNRNTRKLDPVWTYQGATPDGIVPMSSGSATHTGYYYRKMMDELIPYQGGGNTNRVLPVIRYAEILLNLAEAANETGNTDLAMEQLHAIRQRAGIPAGADGAYGLPANPSKDEARELIRRERFIELAFEGKRFFDIKRWKAGDMIDGKYSVGMQVVKSGNTYTYNRVNLQLLNFKDNLYLFPIPQGEISANLGILQNPGW